MFLSDAKTNKVKLLLTIFLLAAFWPVTIGLASAVEVSKGRKAIILVIDRIGIDDIAKTDMPNFERLVNTGGIGLMNVRGKTFGWENRSTGYLSLGTGRRTSYPEDSGKAGRFGRMAREKGLKLAVIDKTAAKSLQREVLLLAADERGQVPYSAISDNDDVLLAEFENFYENADIIVVNYDEKPGKLGGADKFLGRIMTRADRENTLFMVITPNPSEEMIRQGNSSLTPVAMSGPGIGGGILTSNTTKRLGLLANIDFAPTVLRHFGINYTPEFIGEPIESKKFDSPLTYLKNSLAEYRNLKVSRYIIHGFYITFAVLSMTGIYMSVLGNRRAVELSVVRTLAASALTLPLATFILSPFIDFSQTYFKSLLIVLAALMLGYLISRLFRNILLPLGVASLLTGFVLLGGLFSGGGYYLDSPLGFADVFLGGRYYGMNNDTMGIMLGASVLGLFVLFQSMRLTRWPAAAVGLLYTLPFVIGLTPPYGANVGGTIAAMVVTVVTVTVLIGNKPVNWRQILLIVVAVFAVEVCIAYLDAVLNSESTHAGKVLVDLMSGHFWPKFLHILWSKLSLFLLMLVVPPWNLVLLGEFYLVYKMYRRGEFSKLYETNPYLAKCFTVLFFGGVVAFLFNDTGVIATAMMFTYLVIPIGLSSCSGVNTFGNK